MFTKPVTGQCERVLCAREHAILGISPFNSFFSRERLNWLVQWADTSFDGFHIYIPDGPVIHTLLACGYEPKKARKKARRQINYLANKIKKALQEGTNGRLQYSECVLCTQNLTHNQVYQEILDKVLSRFEDDPYFRNGCIKTSRWVLAMQEDQPNKNRPANADLIAAQYFLAELPLFMEGAQIAGVKSSVFCYPTCPEFLRELFSRERDGFISAEQGFVEITPREKF